MKINTIINNTFLLRLPVAIILFVHSIAGMFNNGINDFGNFYLNEIGFAPIGVYLAWAIKLSHFFAAICLLLDKYVKLAGFVTIFVLIMGIILVHFREGWFVVGGGRNGIEFNFLLIFTLLAIMFPNGLQKKAPDKALRQFVQSVIFSTALSNYFFISTERFTINFCS